MREIDYDSAHRRCEERASSVEWGKLTSRSFASARTSRTVAILPLGSLEQHGPHLPLSTDTELAYRLAVDAAEEAHRKGLSVLVLPPVPYGHSPEWMGYPGTVSLSPESLVNIVKDVLGSLGEQGIERVLILNAHGGNSGVLEAALPGISREGGKRQLRVMLVNWWDLLGERRPEGFWHADEFETSLALHYGLADEGAIPSPPSPAAGPPVRGSDEANNGAKPCGEDGVCGRPWRASAEVGKDVASAIKSRLVELITELSKL